MADVLPDEDLEQASGAAAEAPWLSLRRQVDRGRYLRMLSPRRVNGDEPGRPDPAAGIRRPAHPLLGSPASVTRTATNFPDQRDVRAYLRHSADLTMRGGNAAGLVYPLAACALAEHYVFRRVAGSSTGAVAAAATAAAELGRTVPAPAAPPARPGVQPGFAGLAELVCWLAGDAEDAPEKHRLARMLQPAARTRGLFRLLVVGLRAQRMPPAEAVQRLVVAGLSVPGRGTQLVLGLVWAACALGWLGLTGAFVAGSRAGGISSWVTIGASVVLLLALAAAAVVTTVLVECLAVLHAAASIAEQEYFGLVPGVEQAGRAGGLSAWFDRRAGMPESGDVPALMTWVTDRIDDLCGIPPGAERRALTFGDLWAGEVGGGRDTERDRLCAASAEHRVIDLALVASDLSGRRPYRFPLPPAGAAERSGGTRFLCCETCLLAVLPQRVVTQTVKASPSTPTDHACPRHPSGVLYGLPEPWDLPVALAVRLSCSPPGLARAVPLYSVERVRPAARHDVYGGLLAAAPGEGDRHQTTIRTHWFADGGLTNNVPVNYFDTLLPRWPTFGINLEHAPDDAAEEAVRLPAQDAEPARRAWRSLASLPAFLGALLDTVLGWRDSAQADLPGFRGRVAMVRRALDERGEGFLAGQGTLLALALRGLHAGAALRERFTGGDDGVPGQTQTDRYRWVRLRMALREYRGMSLDIGARLPLYRDLAGSYHVPAALTPWFDPPLPPAERDPLWADAGSFITTLRAMSAGGVLDFDVARGAPPADLDLRIVPPE